MAFPQLPAYSFRAKFWQSGELLFVFDRRPAENLAFKSLSCFDGKFCGEKSATNKLFEQFIAAICLG